MGSEAAELPEPVLLSEGVGPGPAVAVTQTAALGKAGVAWRRRLEFDAVLDEELGDLGFFESGDDPVSPQALVPIKSRRC